MSTVDELEGKFKVLDDAIQNGPKRFKKSFDLDDLTNSGSPGEKDKLANLNEGGITEISGYGCKKLVEPLPKFIRADCEKVLAGENNTYIVLGRDRNKSKLSGYGGAGHTKAGSIDIVVGRLGSDTSYKAKGRRVQAEADFEKDSARIYISQKSDIDEYFSLEPTMNAPLSEARSSIGMKADTIRLVARENIRIVTEGPGKNSLGGSSLFGGIDLVAGNRDIAPYTDVQPLVKGKNLVSAMNEVMTLIEELRSTLVGFITHQQAFNLAVQTHTHQSPFYGLDTSPSKQTVAEGLQISLNVMEKTIMSTKAHAYNLQAFKKNYLSPAVLGEEQANYILSRFNGTN